MSLAHKPETESPAPEPSSKAQKVDRNQPLTTADGSRPEVLTDPTTLVLPAKKLGRKVLAWGLGISTVVAGAAAWGITSALGPRQSGEGTVPNPSETVATAPVTPGNPNTLAPSPNVYVPEGDPLNLNVLNALTDPDEVEARATFKEGDFSTIEEFAKRDVYRDNAFMMAGADVETWKQDFSKFPSADEFIAAQDDAYGTPILQGTYAEGVPTQQVLRARDGIIQTFDSSLRYQRSEDPNAQPYSVSLQFEKLLSSSGSVKAGHFEATYLIHRTDNLDATGLKKWYGTLEGLKPLVQKSVKVELQDGKWKTTYSEQNVVEE